MKKLLMWFKQKKKFKRRKSGVIIDLRRVEIEEKERIGKQKERIGKQKERIGKQIGSRCPLFETFLH